MPAIANYTVKKADGTTDIVFNAMSGSAGDNSPAFWRQDTGAAAGLPIGLRSTLKVSSGWNGPKTARRVTLQGVFPYAVQDSTTTLYMARDRALFDGVFLLPQSMPSTNLLEFVHQMCNLISNQQTKDQAYYGYAAT